MHIHQSVRRGARPAATSSPTPRASPRRPSSISSAGQQRYLPAVTCMLAPYVNSYRRLVKGASAPVNVPWGYDNRTTGLRVPPSSPANRRVENRVPLVRRQSVSGHRRFARLRLPRPDRRLAPSEPVAGIARSTKIRPAGGAAGGGGPVRGNRGTGETLRPQLRHHLRRRQTRRIRHLHARDQPLGAGVLAAERLGRERAPPRILSSRISPTARWAWSMAMSV